MRMVHGCYPGAEQTDESPTNAPQTEQYEGEDQTHRRDGQAKFEQERVESQAQCHVGKEQRQLFEQHTGQP